MKYRPEVDGLRTVAVVPVILFHAGFSLFSGGESRGFTSYSMSMAGCIGVSEFYRVDHDANHQCARYNEEYRAFIREADIDTVILTSRFPLYVWGERFNNGEGGQEAGDPAWIDLVDFKGQAVSHDDPARAARVLERYRSGILELLEDTNVVLVYPIPEAGWDVFQYAVREAVKGKLDTLDISTSLEAYKARNADVIAVFDAIDHPRLRKVRPDEVFCNTVIPDRCVNAKGYEVFYQDSDHLSLAGSAMLAPVIGEAVADLSRAQ